MLSIAILNHPREANRTRAKIAYVLDKARRKPTQDNLSADERRALSSLTSRDDICIVPADKGNKVVVMSREKYHEKTCALLADDSYIKVSKDPTMKKNMMKNLMKEHDGLW